MAFVMWPEGLGFNRLLYKLIYSLRYAQLEPSTFYDFRKSYPTLRKAIQEDHVGS